MEKEQKNQKIIIALLSILIIILLAFGIYFIFIKGDKNNGNVDVNETEDLNKVADILISKIDKYRLNMMDYENFTISNVPSQESLYAMFNYYQQQFDNWENSYMDFTVSKEQVDEYYLKNYNTRLTDYPTYNCLVDNEPLYVFDKEKGSYVRTSNIHGHSEAHEYVVSDIYTNIVKNNDKYELTIVKLTMDEGSYLIGNKAYSDLTGDTSTPEEKDVINYLKIKKDTFSDIKPQYKYVFNKVDGDYFLTSFEKIN